MALTAAARSSSESIREPSRSKMMSFMFLTGSVRIIAFQYSHAPCPSADFASARSCHDERSEASAFLSWAKVNEFSLVAAGQFTSSRQTDRSDLRSIIRTGVLFFVVAVSLCLGL